MSESRAKPEGAGTPQRAPAVPRRFRTRDPAAVIAGLLYEDPGGTVRALEEMLTSEEAVEAALRGYWASTEHSMVTFRDDLAAALSAACAALGAAKKEER